MFKVHPVLILILGFWLSTTASATSAPMPAAGFYSLVNGTDNCPGEIEWAEDCDGFALYPTHQGAALDTLRFCQINKGLKLEQKTGRKTLREVVNRDNFIRKKETVIYIDKDNSLSLLQEDTIVQDGANRFLWEHSKNGKGFSCLYSK